METITTGRGFRAITKGDNRVVSESSAIDFDTEDGLEHPGSSYLWVGPDQHLNREEVAKLRDALTYWLENKRLPE
jgi:hypothetical protein